MNIQKDSEKGRKIMAEENKVEEVKLAQIAGGQTEEEYYAEYEKYGLLDTEEHLLQGKKCDFCNRGKLQFLRYQQGRFGNKEAIYRCSLCNEYAVTALRK